MLSYRRNFIGGRRQAPLGRLRVEVRSPYDDTWLGQAPLAGPGDIDLAVQAAREALQRRSWSGASLEARLAVLERFWNLYVAKADELVLLSARQTALPVTAARELMAQALKAGEARLTTARGALDGSRTDQRRPAGVVAAVAAWNATQPSAVSWLLTSLLAGCSMVLALPPACPLDGQGLGDLLAEAGLPDGVFSIVVADDAACLGMAAHSGIDWLAFSGDATLAADLARARASVGKSLVLGLQSRATGILLPDADLNQVISALGPRLFLASGQGPSNPSRLLAPRHRQAELVEALSALAGALSIGDPRDARTVIGPLISQTARTRATSLLSQAEDAGAEIILPADDGSPRQGAVMAPALAVNVSATMSLFRSEPWAPVATVIPYGDLDEAIAVANTLPGRPSAAVWSDEPSIALEVATRLQAAHVALNPKVLVADLAAVAREREEPFLHLQVLTSTES
ncbi:aldehyde dehydrogenase family protein [Caulobacter sp. CCH9-E1]|uniref:aldehyde dehydrogenase family protein n=1 Tax=Caulobacter sp. CCH9-E1 TaxID=1768768 RepID=UPI00082AB760|nr:aldehyde dehydrogenase family protein [Caulobacter sp. CCH9-E1]